jgi:hypothetical protein
MLGCNHSNGGNRYKSGINSRQYLILWVLERCRSGPVNHAKQVAVPSILVVFFESGLNGSSGAVFFLGISESRLNISTSALFFFVPTGLV